MVLAVLFSPLLECSPKLSFKYSDRPVINRLLTRIIPHYGNYKHTLRTPNSTNTTIFTNYMISLIVQMFTRDTTIIDQGHGKHVLGTQPSFTMGTTTVY